MRRFALPFLLLSLAVFALPAPAVAGSKERAMIKAINKERAERGLKRVRHAPRISRSCRSYARRMIRSNRWAHAEVKRVKGFRGIAEILARTPRRTSPAPVVQMWLNSSVHRRVMVGSRYRYVGVASKTGRMGGKRTTVWVVRFAR